ncbi:MAG TPA: hypothetical protein VK705_01050 [Ferruginibacter sp.]|jgi:hypothetical protein|nr:hypothetical protein [Ferruginibacter sp.]
MKKNKITFLVYCILFCFIGKAQSLKVTKSTKQRWAGGVVGNSGINFNLELETDFKNAIPDTVWINGNDYPLDFAAHNGRYERTMDSVTHKIKYTILISESHSGGYGGPPHPKTDTAKAKHKPVRKFEGVALISYIHKHKQLFLTVKSFTELPPLNYP